MSRYEALGASNLAYAMLSASNLVYAMLSASNLVYDALSASIFAAQMKSFSCSPPMAWVW